jgi:hypothetical protein
MVRSSSGVALARTPAGHWRGTTSPWASSCISPGHGHSYASECRAGRARTTALLTPAGLGGRLGRPSRPDSGRDAGGRDRRRGRTGGGCASPRRRLPRTDRATLVLAPRGGRLRHRAGTHRALEEPLRPGRRPASAGRDHAGGRRHRPPARGCRGRAGGPCVRPVPGQDVRGLAARGRRRLVGVVRSPCPVREREPYAHARSGARLGRSPLAGGLRRTVPPQPHAGRAAAAGPRRARRAARRPRPVRAARAAAAPGSRERRGHAGGARRRGCRGPAA